MKKCLTGCITTVMIFCSFTVHGQEARKNTVAAGFNLSGYSYMPFDFPGFCLGYERLLNKNFSLGLDAGMNLFCPFVEVQGRWYPLVKVFFIGCGLGIGGLFPPDPSYYLFYFVSPAIGLSINIGKKNRWVFIPSITGGLILENWKPFFLIELSLAIGYKF